MATKLESSSGIGIAFNFCQNYHTCVLESPQDVGRLGLWNALREDV